MQHWDQPFPPNEGLSNTSRLMATDQRTPRQPGNAPFSDGPHPGRGECARPSFSSLAKFAPRWPTQQNYYRALALAETRSLLPSNWGRYAEAYTRPHVPDRQLSLAEYLLGPTAWRQPVNPRPCARPPQPPAANWALTLHEPDREKSGTGAGQRGGFWVAWRPASRNQWPA